MTDYDFLDEDSNGIPKVSRKNLQTDKYDYVWTRANGDGHEIGKSDRDRVSKREGYEVLHFIQSLIGKHGFLDKVSDVHRIEDALHHPSLSRMVMRDDLIGEIEKKLKL